MSRTHLVDPQTAQGPVKELLDAVQAKLGLVPNMAKGLANSPAALRSYLAASGALAEGALPAKLREQIALLVAQTNECNYCLAAHATIGKLTGLSPVQIDAAVHGRGDTPRDQAALHFAGLVLGQRGGVSEQDFGAVRKAGFSDGDIAEIVAHVALNVFTNYFNKVASIDIDFPLFVHAHAQQ
jgi:uncharacterized peroxidase-related enzyme